MREEVTNLLIGIILIIAGTGYTIQLLSKAVDANYTLLFMLNILIVYLLLENIKLR